MFRTLLYHLLTAFITVALINCGGNQSQQAASEEESSEMATEPSISLIEVNSPEFPDAALEMIEPLGESNYPAGALNFQFNVKNYQLGIQTSDADTKQAANSAKGQHIHLIINGEPYTALYEPNHSTEFEAGNHVVLAFLSRSYHESLKHYGAYVLRQFSVGETDQDPVDLTKPLLFFSRPKGEYQGKDTEKVLLDFYLINTELSSDGNRVKATINGEEFIIDQWVPHFMEGLPEGESTIKLELVDGNGALVDSPYNSVERTINLVKGAT